MAASVAANGTLVYLSNRAREFQYTWFDRSGREAGKLGEPSTRRGISLSPDGRTLAAWAGALDTSMAGVQLVDLVRNTESRITEKEVPAWSPVWSTDGTRIIYGS